MLFSYNWLKEYLGDNVDTPEKISDVLNVTSFEIESIEEKNGDYIFDIDILPNRAHDCLCHTGVAKEIAINFDLNFMYPHSEKIGGTFETHFEVNIEDVNCNRYMLREIKNIEVGPSPEELKKKLESIGEKSINNVVDITNIVMFELGQPMHAFDKDKLDGEKINIRLSKTGEKITTLDKKVVEFDDEVLVIADTEPLAIAGIKGGNKAEVDGATKNLILESANFHSSYIRKASNKVSVKTDSSKRFENEITPELAEVAMNRVTELLLKYGGSSVEVSNIVDVYEKRPKNNFIVGLKKENLNKLLGIEVQEKDLENILSKLEISFKIVNPKKEVVEIVKSLEGKPYVYGSSVTYDAPDGFDCASLFAYAYSRVGVQIPRMSVDQYFYCENVSEEELEAGDLIFSNTKEGGKVHTESVEFLPGTKCEDGIDHVGMYLGEGRIIHATRQDDKGVLIEELKDSDRFKNITAYGRPVKKDEERYVLEIPSLRLDLRKENDIIEEIGRIYGYEKIRPEPLKGFDKVQNSNKETVAILKIKSELQKLGFSEVITYSFTKKGDVRAIKAMASDKQYLRTSLEKGITEALESGHYSADLLNIDRVNIFEIGKVYPGGEETLVLGLGVRNKNFKKPKASEILRNTLESLNIKVDIKDDQEFVQVELKELIENFYTEEKIEIDFNSEIQVTPNSPYPFVSRDVSVWIPDGKGDENTIFEIVEKNAGDLLKTKRLFDVFQKDRRTSYAARFVFQSNERTLNDEEVGKIMESVYKELKNKEGFEIR